MLTVPRWIISEDFAIDEYIPGILLCVTRADLLWTYSGGQSNQLNLHRKKLILLSTWCYSCLYLTLLRERKTTFTPKIVLPPHFECVTPCYHCLLHSVNKYSNFNFSIKTLQNHLNYSIYFFLISYPISIFSFVVIIDYTTDYEYLNTDVC